MLQYFCEKKIDPILIPFYAAISIPVTFIAAMLTGGGHSSPIFFIPLAFLLGPLLFFLGLLNVLKPDYQTINSEMFLFLGPYVLYMIYGFLLFFLLKKKVLPCRKFILSVVAVHLITTIIWILLFSTTGRSFL